MKIASNLPISAAPRPNPTSRTGDEKKKPVNSDSSNLPQENRLKLSEVAPYSPSGKSGILSGAGENFRSKTLKTFDAIIGV